MHKQYKITIELLIIFIQSFYQTLGVLNPKHYVHTQIKLYNQHAIDVNNYLIQQTTHNRRINQHKQHSSQLRNWKKKQKRNEQRTKENLMIKGA
jgi:hypothetical protein